jgi:DNA-binding CsgD family transcriptional regulator
MLSHRQLSDLIGMIYDCAVDPDRWPATLAAICRSIGCMSGFLLLVDLEQSQHRFAHSWGLSPDWKERYLDYSDQLTGFYSLAFSRQYQLDGEPMIMSRFIGQTGSNGRRVYEELRRALDITDVMQTVVLREERRIAILTASRHRDDGALMDEDAATMRMLAPHIRRAVKIIDILDMKKIEADTLAATLDTFAVGVVVVGEDGRILHANKVAQGMLSARDPIAAVDGILSVRDKAANAELSAAIHLARGSEAELGSGAMGVPLRGEAASVAHVLPLALGDVRTRLMPQATAAVFITRADRPALADISPLARSFDLTAAEMRLLEQLARNATLADAARALRISQETARTHLAHIFSKTGVTRQAELLTLVNRLAPPIRWPEN